MASSLIDELQLDAASSGVSVSALLRKALIVAAKLDVPDLPNWIGKELSGYAPDDAVPPYRVVHGKVKASIMGRWIPVQFPSNDVESKITERRLESAVADIEALLSHHGPLTLDFSAEQQQFLQSQTGEPHAEFTCFIESARLAGILDEIRNQVLRWAIALDKAGVRGEGLTFSGAEKEKAHSIIFQQTGGNATIGVLGNVSDQVNVAAGPRAMAGGIDAAELQQLLSKIREHIPNLSLSPPDRVGLQSTLAELDAVGRAQSVEADKVRQGLGRVLGFFGNAGLTVLSAGLTAYTELWMKQHGLAP